MEHEPEPIGPSLEEVLLKLLDPALLESYKREKERHRAELKAIEAARKRAQAMIRRLIGPLREQKEAELEAEHLERVQSEDDRHVQFMDKLRKAIRNHWQEDPPEQ